MELRVDQTRQVLILNFCIILKTLTLLYSTLLYSTLLSTPHYQEKSHSS